MHDADDEDAEPINVGTVTFLTARLCGDLPDLLDAISSDTTEFRALFDDDRVVDGLAEQFDQPYAEGVLFLGQAHLHPAMRGHDLGAWALAEVLNTMTFGRDILVLGHPSPPGGQDLPAREMRLAPNRLALHWEKVGLVRLPSRT
jgi:hypothetical protein